MKKFKVVDEWTNGGDYSYRIIKLTSGFFTTYKLQYKCLLHKSKYKEYKIDLDAARNYWEECGTLMDRIEQIKEAK